MNQPTSAYIHIPFCLSKCHYCDFISFSEAQAFFVPYVDALCEEIRRTAIYNEKNNAERIKLETIYFGGGTPSILPPILMEKMMRVMSTYFDVLSDAEITVEFNPGSINAEDLKRFSASGLNRASVGVQSFSDNILKTLGRAHNSAESHKMIVDLKKLGIKNISCDVMVGLPGQTPACALETVQNLVRLEVPHISIYSLSIEPGTPFESKYGESIELLMPQENERRMYWDVSDFLYSEGYTHYEISNYARPGFESRHNTHYWKGREYFGFGCAAHGYMNRLRYSNIASVEQYIDAANSPDRMLDIIRKPEEWISDSDAMNEFFLLGLRLLKGVSEKDFIGQFGPMPNRYKSILQNLVRSGWLNYENDYYKLSKIGLDYANIVFREFI